MAREALNDHPGPSIKWAVPPHNTTAKNSVVLLSIFSPTLPPSSLFLHAHTCVLTTMKSGIGGRRLNVQRPVRGIVSLPQQQQQQEQQQEDHHHLIINTPQQPQPQQQQLRFLEELPGVLSLKETPQSIRHSLPKSLASVVATSSSIITDDSSSKTMKEQIESTTIRCVGRLGLVAAQKNSFGLFLRWVKEESSPSPQSPPSTHKTTTTVMATRIALRGLHETLSLIINSSSSSPRSDDASSSATTALVSTAVEPHIAAILSVIRSVLEPVAVAVMRDATTIHDATAILPLLSRFRSSSSSSWVPEFAMALSAVITWAVQPTVTEAASRQVLESCLRDISAELMVMGSTMESLTLSLELIHKLTVDLVRSLEATGTADGDGSGDGNQVERRMMWFIEFVLQRLRRTLPVDGDEKAMIIEKRVVPIATSLAHGFVSHKQKMNDDMLFSVALDSLGIALTFPLHHQSTTSSSLTLPLGHDSVVMMMDVAVGVVKKVMSERPLRIIRFSTVVRSLFPSTLKGDDDALIRHVMTSPTINKEEFLMNLLESISIVVTSTTTTTMLRPHLHDLICSIITHSTTLSSSSSLLLLLFEFIVAAIIQIDHHHDNNGHGDDDGEEEEEENRRSFFISLLTHFNHSHVMPPTTMTSAVEKLIGFATDHPRCSFVRHSSFISSLRHLNTVTQSSTQPSIRLIQLLISSSESGSLSSRVASIEWLTEIFTRPSRVHDEPNDGITWSVLVVMIRMAFTSTVSTTTALSATAGAAAKFITSFIVMAGKQENSPTTLVPTLSSLCPRMRRQFYQEAMSRVISSTPSSSPSSSSSLSSFIELMGVMGGDSAAVTSTSFSRPTDFPLLRSAIHHHHHHHHQQQPHNIPGVNVFESLMSSLFFTLQTTTTTSTTFVEQQHQHNQRLAALLLHASSSTSTPLPTTTLTPPLPSSTTASATTTGALSGIALAHFINWKAAYSLLNNKLKSPMFGNNPSTTFESLERLLIGQSSDRHDPQQQQQQQQRWRASMLLEICEDLERLINSITEPNAGLPLLPPSSSPSSSSSTTWSSGVSGTSRSFVVNNKKVMMEWFNRLRIHRINAAHHNDNNPFALLRLLPSHLRLLASSSSPSTTATTTTTTREMWMQRMGSKLSSSTLKDVQSIVGMMHAFSPLSLDGGDDGNDGFVKMMKSFEMAAQNEFEMACQQVQSILSSTHHPATTTTATMTMDEKERMMRRELREDRCKWDYQLGKWDALMKMTREEEEEGIRIGSNNGDGAEGTSSAAMTMMKKVSGMWEQIINQHKDIHTLAAAAAAATMVPEQERMRRGGGGGSIDEMFVRHDCVLIQAAATTPLQDKRSKGRMLEECREEVIDHMRTHGFSTFKSPTLDLSIQLFIIELAQRSFVNNHNSDGDDGGKEDDTEKMEWMAAQCKDVCSLNRLARFTTLLTSSSMSPTPHDADGVETRRRSVEEAHVKMLIRLAKQIRKTTDGNHEWAHRTLRQAATTAAMTTPCTFLIDAVRMEELKLEEQFKVISKEEAIQQTLQLIPTLPQRIEAIGTQPAPSLQSIVSIAAAVAVAEGETETMRRAATQQTKMMNKIAQWLDASTLTPTTSTTAMSGGDDDDDDGWQNEGVESRWDGRMMWM